MTSRRGVLLALSLWLLAFLGGIPLGSRFEKDQKNDPASFLPAGAESSKVLALGKEFPGGTVTPAVIIIRRGQGLTVADRAAVGRIEAGINAAKIDGLVAPVRPGFLSKRGDGVLLIAPIAARGENDVLSGAVDKIRAIAGRENRTGLEVAVSGPAGFSADANKVFDGINGKLLLSAGVLVFVLLILIYRSPIFWFLPLLSVVVAESSTRAVGDLIARSGITVNGQAGGILSVLVFGAGTDYALLLVARYREELRAHEMPRDAMRVALTRAGPTILASAGTVIAGLLCLVLADVNGTAGLGPIGAMGVAVAMIAMLTFLPALLIIGGRKVFWPFVPAFGSSASDATHGSWRRLGEWVARRSGAVAIGSSLILVALCGGLAMLNTNLTSGNSFRDRVESVRGQELIDQSFPAGANAPASILVADPAKVAGARRAAERSGVVASLGPNEVGPPGTRFSATLREDPFSTKGFALIAPLRAAVAPSGALVGGATAEEADLRTAASRDTKLIVPIVLLVVLAILIVLLRSLVAPVLLILTVVLSYLASLGVSAVVFRKVFDFPGSDPSFPLFAFVFLVALGVDYNIFLMARAREESLVHGTKEGMLRALAVTGGVITSAGIVLAGTFAVLGVLPIVFLTQIGFAVAFGVLLDTFLVRSILVPALVVGLGERTWWPQLLGGGAPRANEGG